MNESKQITAEQLVAELEELDFAIAGLISRRVDLAGQLARQTESNAGPALGRLARDAMLLRKLDAQIEPPLPRRALVRIWRELVAEPAEKHARTDTAVLEEQGSFRPSLRLLARDFIGGRTRFVPADSAHHVVRLLEDGEARLAALPWPSDEERWWCELLSPLNQGEYRVVARIPFVEDAGAPQAAILADLPVEESGDDLTLLAIEAQDGVSRTTIRDLLESAGLDPMWLSSLRDEGSPTALHAFEISAFHDHAMPTVDEALACIRAEVLQIVVMGGYPRPLEDDEH